MEGVLNGYVTNRNPTPTLTPNPNRNPNSNPNANQINEKIQKETTLEIDQIRDRSLFMPRGGTEEKIKNANFFYLPNLFLG